MKIELTNEIALVTGASRGIGQAIAQTLAMAGAKVVGTATTPEGAKRISDSFAEQGLTLCLIYRKICQRY